MLSLIHGGKLGRQGIFSFIQELIMKIDLHVHDNSFDSAGMRPSKLVDRAHKIGLHGFAVTNHNSLEAGMESVEYGRRKGFPIFPGVEISTDRGHLLVYGIENDDWQVDIESGLPSAADILSRLDRERTAVFLAHPFFDSFYISREMLLNFLPHVDGVESINGSKFIVNRILEEKMAGVEMRSIGGSDAHEPVRLGNAYTEFTATVASLEDLIRELKSGVIKPVLGVKPPALFRW